MEKQVLKVSDLKVGMYLHSYGTWYNVSALFHLGNGIMQVHLVATTGTQYVIQWPFTEEVMVFAPMDDDAKKQLKNT